MSDGFPTELFGEREESALVFAPAAAVAILGAGLIAALIVPGSRAGLGLAIAAVAVLGAAVVGMASRRGAWRAVTLGGAALLATTPLLRDAPWLVATNLTLALLFAAAALSPGGTWTQMARAAAAILPWSFRGPTEALRTIFSRLAGPAPASLLPVLRGGLLSLGLLVVFSLLFASADGAFAHLFGQLSPELSSDDLALRICAALLGAGAAGALAMVAVSDGSAPRSEGPRPLLGPTEWTIALVSLIALFSAFVVVQFVVLFGGDDHVLQTAGLTYAEYAREGFGQLLVAAALVIGMVSAALRYTSASGRGQIRLRRALLAALCGLTLIVVASALHRLDLYVDAFGATRTRLVAAALCAWVGGVLVLVLASVFTESRRWVPRSVMLLSMAIAIAVTAVNPDGTVAGRNVDRFEQTGRIDTGYAASLSADATPELTRLPQGVARDILAEQAARLGEPDGAFGFNLARERARGELGL